MGWVLTTILPQATDFSLLFEGGPSPCLWWADEGDGDTPARLEEGGRGWKKAVNSEMLKNTLVYWTKSLMTWHVLRLQGDTADAKRCHFLPYGLRVSLNGSLASTLHPAQFITLQHHWATQEQLEFGSADHCVQAQIALFSCQIVCKIGTWRQALTKAAKLSAIAHVVSHSSCLGQTSSYISHFASHTSCSEQTSSSQPVLIRAVPSLFVPCTALFVPYTAAAVQCFHSKIVCTFVPCRPWPWHAIESQLRQLADLAFLLRAYEYAAATPSDSMPSDLTTTGLLLGLSIVPLLCRHHSPDAVSWWGISCLSFFSIAQASWLLRVEHVMVYHDCPAQVPFGCPGLSSRQQRALVHMTGSMSADIQDRTAAWSCSFQTSLERGAAPLQAEHPEANGHVHVMGSITAAAVWSCSFQTSLERGAVALRAKHPETHGHTVLANCNTGDDCPCLGHGALR
eukprot:411743-Pelagomonas_calceolata.AAC.2